MNPIEKNIDDIVTLIRHLAGTQGHRIAFDVTGDNSAQIIIHGVSSNEEGAELLRRLGIGKRNKVIVDEDTVPWHALSGQIGKHTIECFCIGLPKSCRKVTYKEKVPKTQTVDTGDFVEVTRQKVVCGNGELEAA